MTDKLPPNLLQLFAARPPLRWLEFPDYAPEKRQTATVGGVAAFLPELKKYKENDNTEPTESWVQARERKKREKQEAAEKLRVEGPRTFKPDDDANIRGDPYKTLMVARLSYEADDRDLEREFGRYGQIERVRVVKNTHADAKSGKSKKPHRGYAFVVFEREKDMRAALDACDGMRIRDRRIKVDVERGRTVQGWTPRRLGGGLGGRGYTRAIPPRLPGAGGFRGGFRGEGGGRGRGGFRGGFGGRGGGFRNDGPRGDRNGYGAPSGAPSGPGFDRRNGDRGYGGGYESRGGGRSYDDRHGGYRDGGGRFGDRDNNRRTGSNMEPIGRREGGRERDRDGGRDGGYRDRDFDRSRDDDNRKRGYDGGGYEDPRKLRRY